MKEEDHFIPNPWLPVVDKAITRCGHKSQIKFSCWWYSKICNMHLQHASATLGMDALKTTSWKNGKRGFSEHTCLSVSLEIPSFLFHPSKSLKVGSIIGCQYSLVTQEMKVWKQAFCHKIIVMRWPLELGTLWLNCLKQWQDYVLHGLLFSFEVGIRLNPELRSLWCCKQ